jgi:aminopeptidase N
VRPYELESGTETDPPITSLSTLLTGQAYFLNSYPKPAFGYLYVKDLLGDSLFTIALHHYIRQWNGKHPLPLDFFNSMNEGSGRNLNWFWKRWFYDNGFPDLAISSVTKKLKSYGITIAMKGTKPVPVDINITFADQSTQTIHRAVDVWEKGNTTFEITVPTAKRISRITLGSLYVPDANHSDNVYEVK